MAGMQSPHSLVGGHHVIREADRSGFEGRASETGQNALDLQQLMEFLLYLKEKLIDGEPIGVIGRLHLTAVDSGLGCCASNAVGDGIEGHFDHGCHYTEFLSDVHCSFCIPGLRLAHGSALGEALSVTEVDLFSPGMMAGPSATERFVVEGLARTADRYGTTGFIEGGDGLGQGVCLAHGSHTIRILQVVQRNLANNRALLEAST